MAGAPTALVLADEPDATVLVAALTRIGHHAEVVRSSLGAAAAIQQRNFIAVIIAEAFLPSEMSTLLNAMRRESTTPIVIAGWGDVEVRTETLLAGADAYLTRPIPDEVLRARLRSLNSRRSMSSRGQQDDSFSNAVDLPEKE